MVDLTLLCLGVFLGFIILMGIFLIVDVYKFEKSKDCFENIAKDYCREKGWFYDSSYADIGRIVFECKEINREIKPTKKLEFTEKELIKCGYK